MAVLSSPQKTETVRLKGTIKKILFPRPVKPDTDFMIAVLAGPSDIEITIKGKMCGVHEKDELTIEGHWVNDKKHGLQIELSGWEKPVPTTKAQAITLLSSSIIKGCGPKTANLIVETLGDNAIEVIMRDGAACLFPIKGVGKKNATKIVESLSENFNVQNIIKNLGQYGVTVKMAIKLHHLYKGNAVPVIQANPYELTNLSMVGFDAADSIAKKMEISEDSSFRCQAAILYVLRQYEGHCYTEKGDLITDVLNLLNKRSLVKTLGKEDVESALYFLSKASKIVIDFNRIYLKALYHHECTAARKIAEMVTSSAVNISKARIAHEIVKYQTQNRIILNAKQQEAIYTFFSKNIMILTGGPGTGKTAVIKAIAHIYRQVFPNDKELILCAPTGRASQNLHKTSGFGAKTVHRVLNWGIKTTAENEITPDKALKDELNPLEEDLIVDEWSMADIELASSTLRAIPKGGKVLVVGDPDQLPSVGPGAVLRDMINSQCVHRVHLDEVYRQAKNSQITENAYRVKEGRMIDLDSSRKDFIFIERPDAASTQQMILACVKRLLEKGYRPEDILVLSPIKKGTAGVEALNDATRALVNPADKRKKELVIGNKLFRVGDVIIQNQRNSVAKNLYNGTMGTIKAICSNPDDPESKEEGLLCDLWGKEVFLTREDITEFDFTTGYSITIHKSQGGQAKVVISPVLTNHFIMLTRNNLLTSMTRAEEMMILVGQKKAVAMAIKNDTPNLRRTYLSERIWKCVREEQEKQHRGVVGSLF
ncbi:SF1B family DNA helicase RecD2 [Desulfitobacterium hafniense]|uniref:SF1B family DNA helicase RecD2 n=1 Tax=Desulfitobacterium hafniense TaxID=49338 RepID=UPI00037EDE1C|nr:ATP-dependent RecD-like DNA helicase [Desulfitobacterium hafniense]